MSMVSKEEILNHLERLQLNPEAHQRYSMSDTLLSIDVIEKFFGWSWFEKRFGSSIRKMPNDTLTNHAFDHVNTYLKINHLADDIGVTRNSSNFSQIISDLKGSKSYQNHRHTLHCAAIFERGGNKLIQFIKPTNMQSPDFEVGICGRHTLVECKFYRRESVVRKEWFDYARPLIDSIVEYFRSDNRSYRPFEIAIKDYKNLPNADDVINMISTFTDLLSCEQSIIHTAEGEEVPPNKVYIRALNHAFNLIISTNLDQSHVSRFRQIEICCPLPQIERDRISNLRKKASKQIRSFQLKNDPAIIAFGAEDLGDASVIEEVIYEHNQRPSSSRRINYLIISSAYANSEKYVGPVDYMKFLPSQSGEPLGTFDLAGAGHNTAFPQALTGNIRVMHMAKITGNLHSPNWQIFVPTRYGAPSDYFK